MGKNTRVGCHFLLQGTFLTQGSNLHLLLGRHILYHWEIWEAHKSHTIHFMHLKCPVHWFLVYLELCNHYHSQLRPCFSPQEFLLIFVSFNKLYLVIVVCYLCFKFSFYQFLNLFSFLSMQKYIYIFWGECSATWLAGSYFPKQELNPGPGQWKWRVLTTGPPGCSLEF